MTVERKPRLDGRVAIVTGGGGGIGGAICRAFVAEGCRVVVADVDRAAAEGTARPLGDAAVAIACDVSDPAAAERATATALERFGALHVLVNNAALFTEDSTVETISLEDWNRTMAVNLTGAVLMSKYAIPALRAAGQGSIIHVASQLGQVGKAGRAWYCVAKAGLIHLAKTMAIDHAADGIRVNSLSPGPIGTERIVRRAGGPAAAAALYAPLTLMGRAGEADEIADAALFLASNESRFMTGADLLVDGGYTAR